MSDEESGLVVEGNHDDVRKESLPGVVIDMGEKTIEAGEGGVSRVNVGEETVEGVALRAR